MLLLPFSSNPWPFTGHHHENYIGVILHMWKTAVLRNKNLGTGSTSRPCTHQHTTGYDKTRAIFNLISLANRITIFPAKWHRQFYPQSCHSLRILRIFLLSMLFESMYDAVRHIKSTILIYKNHYKD